MRISYRKYCIFAVLNYFLWEEATKKQSEEKFSKVLLENIVRVLFEAKQLKRKHKLSFFYVRSLGRYNCEPITFVEF